MPDQLTLLENKLDEIFANGRDQLAFPGHVQSWEDYIQRRGYLTAISDVGRMIKEVRNPEVVQGNGDIPGILEEIKNG